MKRNNVIKVSFAAALILSVFSVRVNAKPVPADRHKVKHASGSAKRTNLKAIKFSNILFGFNKINVPVKYQHNLDKVAKLMADSSVSVKLGGYADSKGGYVYNWKLSKKRADAVKAYLVSKGADSTKIAATEYGYTHPVASNATPSGRQKNRRVEIQFAN